MNSDEYLELYNSISGLRKSEIKDVKLSSGRIVKRDDILSCIKNIQETTAQRNKSSISEFVVFNPKIEAVVVDSNSQDIQDINKSDVLIVLI